MAKKRSTLLHKERLNVKRNKRKEHKVHFMSWKEARIVTYIC